MDQSNVYQRIHFLRELGAANATTRKLLIRCITREQMEALAEVVRYILNGALAVLVGDVPFIRERSLSLRQLIDPRISLRRKRNTLLLNQDIVPRLLRRPYLNRAILLSVRTGEQ